MVQFWKRIKNLITRKHTKHCPECRREVTYRWARTWLLDPNESEILGYYYCPNCGRRDESTEHNPGDVHSNHEQ